MSEEFFRKKSIDQLKSPERLDESIKVTNPGVWLILAAVVLLLVGACVWGAFGHIDSITPVSVYAENGVLIATAGKENITSVKTGMTVRFSEYEATVKSIEKADGEYVCTLSENETVPDGFYDGNIVVQSFKPFSFIWN